MVISVLVEIANKNVDKLFDYKVPSSLEDQIKIGLRVLVPFASRTLEGFVLKIKEKSEEDVSLKEVLAVLDQNVILNDELLDLGKWLAKKTLSSLISCYQVMLPKALKAKKGSQVSKKYEKVYVIHREVSCPLTEGQKEIVQCFEKKDALKRGELSSFSKARLDTLVKKGVLEEVLEEVYRLQYDTTQSYDLSLTEEQEKAVEEILQGSSSCYLLHGVTGSGKTEVYMELIAMALKAGKKSIMLVPEISLTPQMLKRFQARFGDRIAALHSSLSDGERYDEWRRIARGEVDVVIGARSAVFAPLKDLGFIILDEEHSDSYKQESIPRYDAREVALKRIQYYPKAKVVLGSATPTLESYARAKKHVFQLVELPHRVNGRRLPTVTLIDMNQEIKRSKGHFSSILLEALKECFEREEQAILLLNRRGYSTVISCRNCGYVEKCPHCDITLTYHKSSKMLRCHYCGYGTPIPKVCPSCHEDSLQDLGVGTEKIEEELKTFFPQARVLRMDVDTMSRKGAHEKMINSFQKKEADILLGTQMVAKGLDFANVTLVGVINADTSLMIPDFRSSEVTFDLLSQVAGRSGRSEKEGRVYFQTYNKDHYAIRYAKENNYLKFYQEEMKIRKMMKYPPYYYLVLCTLASKNQEEALKETKRCEKVFQKYLDQTILLGPTPASIFKKQNIYRYQLILKYQYQDNLYEVLGKLVDYYASNYKVKLEIDFHPLHL